MKSFDKLRQSSRHARRRIGRLENLEDRRLLAALPPDALNDLYQVQADQPLDVSGPGVLANDATYGASLSAHLFSGPNHGLLNLTEDGAFNYTPDAGYVGLDSFVYWAQDGDLASMLAAVTLRVSANGGAPTTLPDSYTVNEDDVLGVTASAGVLDNDTANGGAMIAELVTGPEQGELELNADGSFTYTPAPNFNGSDSFVYQARTGDAVSEPTTVTLTVRPQNDRPTAANDRYSATEDQPLVIESGGVLDNDADVDGDPLTAQLVSGPLHGSVTLNEDGTFTYTPSADFHGIDGFSYLAHDGTIASQVATVTINVAAVNDAPLANNDEYTIDEDTELTIDAAGILANDSDVDGDSLTAVLVDGPQNGELTLNADGSFSYIPNADFNGVDGFSYMVNDGTTESAVATVTINVNPVNDGPAAADDAYEVDEDATLIVDPTGILGNDSDPDGDALTPVLVEGPLNGALVLSEDGSFTYTPNANFHGSDSFTYQVTDGEATSSLATVSITVNPVNDAPLANNDEYTIDEDTELTIDAAGILANDSDVDGDSLTAVLVDGPQNGELTLNADGSFSYIPNADFNGVDGFSYMVNDGTTESAVATVTINVNPVNDGPLANNDEYTIDEDTTLTIDAAGVLANDTDVDGDALTAVLVDGPQNGELTLNSDGSFVYTPNADFFGVDGFSYLASDGEMESAVATVTINITPVNDAPLAVDDAYSVNEDEALVVEPAGLLANDSDPEGDLLTVIILSPPTAGMVIANDDGSFTYTPLENFHGLDSFTYKVTDGTSESNEATVTIDVVSVNDSPVAADDAYELDEDTTLTIDAPGLLANDSDLEGDPLTAVLVSGPAHGALTLNPDGSFSYTPAANYFGEDAFTYKANDGADDSEAATVVITINPVPDAPHANDDAYSIGEDYVLAPGSSQGVLANDFDPEGQTLTAELVSEPEHGTLVFSSDGSFSYTPDEHFHGSDSFTYVATNGLELSATRTVSITVEPINDRPVAESESYDTAADSLLVVEAASGVLANDSDVDGDPLTAILLWAPTHGELSFAGDGSFTYTPAAGFVGQDRFFYQASDGLANSNVMEVVINIGGATGGGDGGGDGGDGGEETNSAPQGVADSYTVASGATLSLDGPGVLANDSDADGDLLTAALVEGPAHGALTLGSDGSLSYTPDDGFLGEDSFTYEASDGVAGSGPVTVTINVTDSSTGNVAPVSANDSFGTSVNTPLVIPAAGVLGNDSDANGDTLTAILVDSPSHGVLALAADGSFSYTPEPGYTGVDAFTYQATDGAQTGNIATVTITIASGDNSRPNAVNDQYTITGDSTLNVEAAGVLTNDSDAQGSLLTALLFSAPQHGTVSLAADGSFAYTPDAGYTGLDSFIYRAFDGQTYSALAAVTIRISPAQAPLSAPVNLALDIVAEGQHEDDGTAELFDALYGNDEWLL
jgi:VCBS repeat-containing protein